MLDQAYFKLALSYFYYQGVFCSFQVLMMDFLLFKFNYLP